MLSSYLFNLETEILLINTNFKGDIYIDEYYKQYCYITIM